MSDQVILVVGTSSKFLMRVDEAMEVCRILNSCNRITTKWASGGNKDVIAEPADDASYVVPFTALRQITLEQNMKELAK